MKTRVSPSRFVLFAFCALIGVMALTLTYTPGRGATPNLLPLPIAVPVPEGVIFTDGFADAMAVDGDILAVGAPNTAVNGNAKQGVVYLYIRDNDDPTSFTLLKTITSSDGAANDAFGYAVAVHGDTLVVGDGASSESAAYVFARNHGGPDNWGETRKLVRGDSRTLTYFGHSLAVHGDTILVGAPLGLGEVFVFERNEGGAEQWGQTQILDSGLPITTSIKVASFGTTLVFDGDKIAISAPRLGLTARDAPDDAPPIPTNYVGAVFVYHQENGDWLPEAKLFSHDLDLTEDPMWDDNFGSALALNNNTLFVGAPQGRTEGDVTDVATGKVFVYQPSAGEISPFGTPGGWGLVAALTSSDGVEDDAFGTTLYAIDDGLFVGATKQGVSHVYFFRDPASTSVAAPQVGQVWGELYRFNANDDVSSSAFGKPLVGSGDVVLFGDAAANAGGGGVYAYAKAALFAHDPDATPTPTDTPPTVTPPDEVEPCVPEQQAEPVTRVYLPSVAGGTAQTQRAAHLTPHAPTALYTESLGPGCVLVSPDGVRLAAVEGAITRTLAISIESVGAPAQALPAGSTAVGGYWRLAAHRDKYVSMDTPFVIALPVPANVDTSHLAIAVLLSATHTLDGGATGLTWEFLPGTYDEATKLLLATMPFVRAEGTTLLLVDHPDLDSPTNQPPPQAQSAATTLRGEFTVYCFGTTFENPDECTPEMEATTKEMLDGIYQRMTDSQIFDFPRKLRLLNSGSNFIVSETISVTALTADFSAYIVGPGWEQCAGKRGYYNTLTGFLALCAKSGNPIDGEEKEVLIHEFFHAIQYTYPKVLQNYEDKYGDEPWIIEGMAQAAIESYPLTKMARDTYYGEDYIQRVDRALTIGVPNDGLVEEYLAQDFWVYVGLHENESLSYLGTLLAVGGTHHHGIDIALKLMFNKSLSDFYWGWVKHQSIENVYDVGVGPGQLCQLSNDAMATGSPVYFPASEITYPFDTPTAFDTLPPLTAKVIQVDFGERTGAIVMADYQPCSALQEPVAKASCVVAAQQTLKVKIYEEGELDCQNEELPGVIAQGTRRFDNLSEFIRYFVVVANVDPNEEHGYRILIE